MDLNQVLLSGIYGPLIFILFATLARTTLVYPMVKRTASARASQMWFGVIIVLFALLIEQCYYFYSIAHPTLHLNTYAPAIGFIKLLYIAAIGSWTSAIFQVAGVVPKWLCYVIMAMIIFLVSVASIAIVTTMTYTAFS